MVLSQSGLDAPGGFVSMRVLALSDLHVDYPRNMRWIEGISLSDYQRDTILLAGDITHEMDRLRKTFDIFQQRFARVFFVPGNHELWLLKSEQSNSIAKFGEILSMCARRGVETAPGKVSNGRNAVWVVPLFSWYTKPEEGGDSLFVEKPGEDASLSTWSDNYFVKWPELNGQSPNDYFLHLNHERVARNYDAPVISLSHFLPRVDLIFGRKEEYPDGKRIIDRNPGFNFSRVAGTTLLDEQIRTLGSRIHVYGHQHRNRYRVTEGILYVSQCLGYHAERDMGHIHFIDKGPRVLWDLNLAEGNKDLPEPAAVETGA
jgi:hypothetical protein